MFGYRQSKPDHVVQMLFFGKILQALAAPSELIQQFLADSLRVLTFPDGRNPVRARFASFHDFHSQQLDSHVRTRYDPWIHGLDGWMYVLHGCMCCIYVLYVCVR